jgi:hypothetical protein
MQIPIGWFAGSAIIVLPNGTEAAAELPALVAVAVRPSTHPFAAVMLGVVCPVGRTPPSRYQISTGPVVPAAAENTLVIPVKKMGWVAFTSNVTTDEPLFGVVAGMVVIVL